jgi:leucyl aminopeptidase
MKLKLVSKIPAEAEADLLAIPLFQEEMDGKTPPAAFKAMDATLRRALMEGASREGFKGKPEQSWSMHTLGKLPARLLVLLGLGPRARFRAEALRMAAGRAAKTAERVRAASAALFLPSEAAEHIQAATEGLLLGAYRFDRYRTANTDEKNAGLKGAQLLLAETRRPAEVHQRALELGERVGEATNWARDLVNEPAGQLTPTKLAQEARVAARASGLEVSIGGRREIEKLRMGLFLGVAQGSAQEPRLIHLRYRPKNRAHAKRPPVALVGKAITFDSGGLSLKTAEGMLDMKTDMAGSAAVLAAMRVIAALKPPFPVYAFIGACENMPSGTAYRPGDILTSRLGKTVEITNTDAEGRLVLGDMLAWAAEHKPSAIIDLATLTGACVIALGHYVTGAFGDDQPLMKALLKSARAAGEEIWQLPIAEGQKDALRSEVADLKNSGERWGAAINAAIFLKEFVGNTPWVHLDIAGPSVSPKERGYFSKGATGVGVRTLVEFVRSWASALS